ncbi:hypothetical protein [Leucobacter sp. cx-169]|uniref:hypothetical protein n=1 Tax=Leucobacter sp. cx-169 TaxID=2770549 RepID=UPI00165D7608|nr:hypothetical protein [Leucobacter sp. cx-169]MBC9927301.1 hypothetical protein [Leucobacter sp. cx-169]
MAESLKGDGSALHGYTDQYFEIRRHSKAGWYIRGPQLTSMRKITAAAAARAALTGGQIMFGVPGGAVFERLVRSISTEHGFNPNGITACDAADQYRARPGIAPKSVVSVLRLPDCWEVRGVEQKAELWHYGKKSGVGHDPSICPIVF